MKPSSVLNSKRQFKNYLKIVSFALFSFYDTWARKFITTGSLYLSKHLLKKKIPQGITWICAWYGFEHDIIIIWQLLLSLLTVPSKFTLPLGFGRKFQLNIMTVLKKYRTPWKCLRSVKSFRKYCVLRRDTTATTGLTSATFNRSVLYFPWCNSLLKSAHTGPGDANLFWTRRFKSSRTVQTSHIPNHLCH